MGPFGEQLADSDVLTCAVVGFPLGASATEVKAFETATAVAAGAEEIDMVIDIAAARAGERERVEAEAERLASLGATRVRTIADEGLDHYAVALLDPEGNEFDIN